MKKLASLLVVVLALFALAPTAAADTTSCSANLVSTSPYVTFTVDVTGIPAKYKVVGAQDVTHPTVAGQGAYPVKGSASMTIYGAADTAAGDQIDVTGGTLPGTFLTSCTLQ